MSKALFVRGVREDIRKKINYESNKRGVSVASILEEAFEKWMKDAKDEPMAHHLVFYSDQKSLLNFMTKIKELTGNEWVHACLGPESHFAIKYLEKKGWTNVSIPPFSKSLTKPEEYAKKVFKKRAGASIEKPVCSMGFMTEYFQHRISLKNAVNIEKLYNGMRSRGIAFCPFDTKKFRNSDFYGILDLFDQHDKVLILKNNKLYELDINQIPLSTALH